MPGRFGSVHLVTVVGGIVCESFAGGVLGVLSDGGWCEEFYFRCGIEAGFCWGGGIVAV